MCTLSNKNLTDNLAAKNPALEVSCLDSYLDALQLLLWPRLRVVLEANIVSLRKVETVENGENGEIRNKFGEVWDGMTQPIVGDLRHLRSHTCFQRPYFLREFV